MRVVLHYVIITFWFNRFSVDRDYISEVTLTLFSPKADAANMKPNEKGVMSMKSNSLPMLRKSYAFIFM